MEVYQWMLVSTFHFSYTSPLLAVLYRDCMYMYIMYIIKVVGLPPTMQDGLAICYTVLVNNYIAS